VRNVDTIDTLEHDRWLIQTAPAGAVRGSAAAAA
jgi:hypothetical protein